MSGSPSKIKRPALHKWIPLEYIHCFTNPFTLVSQNVTAAALTEKKSSFLLFVKAQKGIL